MWCLGCVNGRYHDVESKSTVSVSVVWSPCGTGQLSMLNVGIASRWHNVYSDDRVKAIRQSQSLVSSRHAVELGSSATTRHGNPQTFVTGNRVSVSG
jgi:hypothetical protein